jgi:hypothetical protein
VLLTNKIVFIGSKEIKYKIPETYLQNYNQTDHIWANEYNFEKTSIILRNLYKTNQKTFKCFLKTIELRYDLVRNDILAKDYNGIKTFITRNTQMFEASLKKLISKPLSTFSLLYNNVQGLLPKLADYYNITGDTVCYHLYQFKENIKYSYVHNLRSYTLAKKDLYLSFYSILKIKGLSYKKNIFAYQHARRRKFRFLLGGFALKFKRRLKKLKIKKIQVFNLLLKRGVSFKKARKKHKVCQSKFSFLNKKTLNPFKSSIHASYFNGIVII